MDEKLLSFINTINKSYGIGTIEKTGKIVVKRIPRVSTGSFMLDYALGGGLPLGRVNLFYGMPSSSKTTMALKTVANFQKKYKDRNAIWVDVEGVWDPKWAEVHGVDTDNLILIQPEFAEHAVDIVDTGIREGIFDFIVIDSVAAFEPIEEAEKSTEKWQQGLVARVMNKAIRKWVSGMIDIRKKSGNVPTLLLINQIRYKINVSYGNPETQGGGMGIRFATSTETRIYHSKMEYAKRKDDDGNEFEDKTCPAVGVFGFSVTKNKVGVPKRDGEWKMSYLEESLGKILDDKIVVEYAEKYGLVEKNGNKWSYNGSKFDRKGDILSLLSEGDKMFLLKDKLMGMLCGWDKGESEGKNGKI